MGDTTRTTRIAPTQHLTAPWLSPQAASSRCLLFPLSAPFADSHVPLHTKRQSTCTYVHTPNVVRVISPPNRPSPFSHLFDRQWHDLAAPALPSSHGGCDGLEAAQQGPRASWLVGLLFCVFSGETWRVVAVRGGGQGLVAAREKTEFYLSSFHPRNQEATNS